MLLFQVKNRNIKMWLLTKQKSKNCVVLRKMTIYEKLEDIEVIIFLVGAQVPTKNINSLTILENGSERHVTITDEKGLLLDVCRSQIKEIEEAKIIIALAKEYKNRANKQ